MSVLVVGLSHRGSPLDLLERVAPRDGAAVKLATAAVGCAHVAEAVVVASCNRVEVYAEVGRFHGGVDELAELLAVHTGVPRGELTPHLYVKYEEGVVAHLFSVACGLESMVPGETQILGQIKTALRQAQDAETVGPVLNQLFQHALRVGKRAHAETDLGRAGRSIVGAALTYAEREIGGLAGRSVLVVGAGSMAALTASVLRRDYEADVAIANRTYEAASRLAESLDGTALGLDQLGEALADADLVVCCTGASGTVLTADQFPSGTETLVLDLAMPRDVDEAVGELPGVRLIGLAELAAVVRDAAGDDLGEVRAIVAEEVTGFESARRSAAAAPTVVALRSMASDVVEAELRRLSVRLSNVPDDTYAEVENTVRRVVDKLLHAPTIRVKELAGRQVETSYADALRELFALDPEAIEALRRPEEPEEPT